MLQSLFELVLEIVEPIIERNTTNNLSLPSNLRVSSIRRSRVGSNNVKLVIITASKRSRKISKLIK
ncbi:hypothetical protein [Calothrix sp. PCC 6303]|uniref:hypothetical protein n=1 Tax=Calothrix sp. PCC 6303 TaxID=1170562 RepID=UPI0011819B05|nr:hypothetical protein [Calothrix sp. PCC 6303]